MDSVRPPAAVAASASTPSTSASNCPSLRSTRSHTHCRRQRRQVSCCHCPGRGGRGDQPCGKPTRPATAGPITRTRRYPVPESLSRPASCAARRQDRLANGTFSVDESDDVSTHGHGFPAIDTSVQIQALSGHLYFELDPSMNAFRMFQRQFPAILRQTAHLTWPLKMHFWLTSLAMSARLSKEERNRDALPRVGDPAKRAECCGLRPDSYGRKPLVKDIPELKDILQARGTSMLGWVHFFQCKVCGQEWMEEWHQEKSGSDYEVKKVQPSV